MPADSTPETPLTNQLSDSIIIDYAMAVFGVEMTSDVTEENADAVMTRGELAEEVYVLTADE